jgi:SAM-dependent methyltransferase
VDLRRRYYPEARFGGFSDVDGTVAFYARVNALVAPEATVIDIGCGRGQAASDPVPFRRDLQVLRGKCARVIGIDPDPIGDTNPNVDEFRRIEKDLWPVSDGEADLCVCDNVLEHVPDPDTFFTECHRVLKPGGYLCIRTPNRMSYFGLASWLLPNRLHARALSRLQHDRECQDVFPTLYRCNTARAIRRMLRKHGFSGCVYGYEAEPSYLASSGILYALGVLHQRLAPRAFRLALFTFAAKDA